MLLSILIVFISGGIGASCRYLFAQFIEKIFHSPSFLSILMINLIGSFCIGLASSFFLRLPNESLKLFVITGFLGGFTTFSSFILDIIRLVESNHYGIASLYFIGHIVLGLCFCFMGLLIGKYLFVH